MRADILGCHVDIIMRGLAWSDVVGYEVRDDTRGGGSQVKDEVGVEGWRVKEDERWPLVGR